MNATTFEHDVIVDSGGGRWSAFQPLLLLSLLSLPVYVMMSRALENQVYRQCRRLEQSWLSILSPLPVHETVARGYKEITKVFDEPFAIWFWARHYLILPPKYLPDLKSASFSQLSFFDSISDALYLHTTVGELYQSDRMVEVVKKGVSPQLPRITTQTLPVHVHQAITKVLGDTDEWKSVPITNTINAIAHRASTPILVCEEAAQDEAFIQASMRFVSSIFENALVIVNLPLGPFRETLAYPLSIVHKRRLQKRVKMLEPIVALRIEARDSEAAGRNYGDALEWTLMFSLPQDDTSASLVSTELLHGLWAATSTPGGLVTNMLFQCLMEPEYTETLREEAQATIDELGWSEAAFSRLRMEDNFIREVNRMFPTGSVTCSRTVKNGAFRFSDGLTLPVNSRISFPIMAMQNDPAVFDNPSAFDGFCFLQMEEASGHEQRWLASTVDSTNLAFGFGSHACPGRFYAIRKVKLIFTKLLLEYEFKVGRKRIGSTNTIACGRTVHSKS